jgi:hypothetical protein
MPPLIPISQHFDQPTLSKLLDGDPVVQRYRTLFALFDWTALQPAALAAGPGHPAHPPSAYVKALLVRIGEHLIPIRLLNDNIEMREASHGREAFFIIRELIESLTEELDERIQ